MASNAETVDITSYRRAVIGVFVSHYDRIRNVLKRDMEEFTSKAFSAYFISSLNMEFSSIFEQFKTGFESCRSILEIQQRYKCFIDILLDIGGPVEVVGNEIEEKLSNLTTHSLINKLLQKHSKSLSQLVLPNEVTQMLYTEGVISKEIFNEVERSGGSLTNGTLRDLLSTVSKDPNKLRAFATILLKSEDTVNVGKNILEDIKSLPKVVHLSPIYQSDFDVMRGEFGDFFEDVISLIKSAILPSSFICVNSRLEKLKRFLGRTFSELKPQLSIAKSFDDVMDTVKEKCTIINIACLKTIVTHYKIEEAKDLIADYQLKVEKFCEKVKVGIMTATTSPSCLLKCESIEFVLEWETDEHTLTEIKVVLWKTFGDFAERVLVKEAKEDNSITVTCYAPQHMMDILLMEAKKNIGLLRGSEIKVIKLTIGYHIVWSDHTRDKEVRELEKEVALLKEKLNYSKQELKKNIDREVSNSMNKDDLPSTGESFSGIPLIGDTIREPTISSEVVTHEEIETHPSLPKRKHKLTDTTQHIVKKPAHDIDISRSHRKRKSDLELEYNEKPSKIPNTTSMDSEQQQDQDQSLTNTLSEKIKLLDKMNKTKTLQIEKLTREKEATKKVLVEKQKEIKKLTREKEATDKVLVEKQKEIEIFQEKISTLTLQLREKEVGKVKDDSKSGNNKVSNARNFPPGSYDLLIIGSYGEVSKSQAITVVQKLIPPHLKGSDQWMTDEIDLIKRKHDKATNCDHIISYLDHVGAQNSKFYYLEQITIFLQECKERNQDKAIIFYTGHGEKNTGNWCFKDGVITFRDIYGIYMAQFQGKRLTINSDCSYSGNWIKDCAKHLDNFKIPSCGHHTRSRDILLNVWSSCDIDQEATALCYVTEAIEYNKRKKVVVTDFNTVLSSGQKTRLGDFRQLNCGNAADQKCGLDDISTITWEDRMFHKPELVQLVKKWYYVLVDEDKLEAFKAEADGTQMFKITNYGKILYEGFGEKPPAEVNRQLDFKFMPTVDPEY